MSATVPVSPQRSMREVYGQPVETSALPSYNS